MTRRGWTLLLVCTATFMLLLDVSVVITALPSIRADLDASFSDVQWAIDAYTLPLAALLLPAATLADLYGRRLVFVVGLVLFTLASAGCAASGSPGMLDAARAVQGVGGALLFATALPLLGQEFQGRDRAGALGVWSATLAGSVAVGPLVGGALTDGLGWQWIFLINLPVGAFAVVAALLRLRESREPAGRRLDLPGLLLLGSSLAALVFATVRGNAEGWTSPLIVGSFVAGSVLLAGFVAVELASPRPMLDLRLFASPTFTAGMAVSFLVSAGMVGTFAYQVILMQSGFGYSALGAGTRFLPLSVLSFVAAAVTGRRLLGRVSTRLLLSVSMLVTGLGALLLARVGTEHTYASMVPGLVVAGFGFGMSTPLLAGVALAAVAPARAGMATGAFNTARQVGVAAGVAAFGALFEARVRSGLSDLLPGVSDAVGSAVAAGGTDQVLAATPPGQRPAVAAAAVSTLADALGDVMLASTGLLAVAFACAALLVRRDGASAAPIPAQATSPADVRPAALPDPAH